MYFLNSGSKCEYFDVISIIWWSAKEKAHL